MRTGGLRSRAHFRQFGQEKAETKPDTPTAEAQSVRDDKDMLAAAVPELQPV